MIVQLIKKLRDNYLRFRRKKYFNSIHSFLGNNTSIICSNCFGGRVIQDIGMKYNTPTVGLFIPYPDYIDFCKQLDHYLKYADLTFKSASRYAYLNDLRSNWAFEYPIGCLDNKIEIHFLHYHSPEDAATKWQRRAKRINWDKLMVIGMDQNGCTVDDVIAFDNLQIKNKIFFSSRQIEGDSIMYLKEFHDKGKVGDPYKKGHIFYKYFDRYIKQLESQPKCGD